MYELQKEKELKYTRKIPSWASNVIAGLNYFIWLIAFAFLGAGIYSLYHANWEISLLMVFAGSVMVWLANFIQQYQRKQRLVLIEVQLRDDGYLVYSRNQRTGEQYEQLVAFHQIQEVLIGRAQQYVSLPSIRHGHYVIGARLVMRWTDEQEEIQYSMFGHWDQEDLHQWITQFQAHRIPIYVTHHDIGSLTVTDMKEGYSELIKQQADGLQDRLLQIGQKQADPLPQWQSTSMLKRERLRHLHRDKRIFKPLFAGVILINFIIAWLWMPHWEMDGNSFDEDSPVSFIGIINFFLIILSRTYWRKSATWKSPIQDMCLLFVVHCLGLFTAMWYYPIPLKMFESVLIDSLTTGVFLVGFYGIMAWTRLKHR